MTDTGPPYPFPPGAGSNAIGSFEIGISQIGDIPPWSVWETIQSQYANSPIITQLITNFAQYIDPTANLAQFYDLVMNVDTAQGYGLDVWGQIVGIARTLTIPTPPFDFGFAEGEPSWQGFNVAPFYFGVPISQTYILSDQAYLKLILAKALSNICDGSIPAINQILINLFCHPWHGNAYVSEGELTMAFFGFAESTTALPFNQGIFYDGSPAFENMLMTYVFDFELTDLEFAIVQFSNVLPKPVGVKALILTEPVRGTPVLVASIPGKFSITWGASAGAGYIRTIPAPSQIGINNGFASLTDGFPPLNFLPLGSGGIPPFGQDMNGILNQLSAWNQWFSAGGPTAWDVTFSSEIGGYPKGALVGSPSTPGIEYLNLVDNNGSNPESSPANWVGASPAFFGNCGGAADAITGTFCTAYIAGQFFIVKNIAFTNATTTPTFNPGSGALTITDRRGNALAPGDLPVSGELMMIADGTGYRYLGIVSADLGAQHVPFNQTEIVNTTRTSFGGINGFTNFTTGTYVKKSATSTLIIRTNTNIFDGNTGANCGVMRVAIGGSNIDTTAHVSTSATSSPACTTERQITGLAAGSYPYTISYGRNDATLWTSIVNPTSSDAGFLPLVSGTSIVFCELEP